MTAQLIRVEVHEDTETLATTVSRDITDGFYELPEFLVVRFEIARTDFEKASKEITDYIESNGLEPRYEED